MEVAIIGAGLSGLSCAITLEKNGITPVIFETKNQVGDVNPHGQAMLSIFTQPINDAIQYLSNEHGIFIQPVGNIRKISIFSENKKCELLGNLGFMTIRGRHPNSVENQLASQVKSKIFYNSKYTYEDLMKNFTHVIVATGEPAYTAKIQEFQHDSTFTVKGASVSGKFETHHLLAWLNNDFTPYGLSFLIPFSETEASMAIGYPKVDANSSLDINVLFEKFFQRVCSDLNQNLEIINGFEVYDHMVGKSSIPRIGNTFFVGNCLCGPMPAFGYGQVPSILSGIYAAMEICGLGNFYKLTKPIYESYDRSLVLRRAMEQTDNKELDTLVSRLNKPIVNRLFNNQRFNYGRIITFALKPYLKIKNKL